jgi:hypothetical protein
MSKQKVKRLFIFPDDGEPAAAQTGTHAGNFYRPKN